METDDKDYYDEVYFDSDQESDQETAGIGLINSKPKKTSKGKKHPQIWNRV